MWWKTILRIAVAVGLDKWAKKKAKKLIEKLRDRVEKKAAALESVVDAKVEKWVAEGEGDNNKYVVSKDADGKITVKRIG